MNFREVVAGAVSRGQKALSEYDSKQLLAAYGVPITREKLTHSADEAVKAASELGFPVAAKACGHKLMHKSEGGLVKLGLDNEDAVRRAYDDLTGRSADLEGVLIQEMISGSRELVAGLVRDPGFGPCVMVGLGGVMTEVFNDTAFRLPPLSRVEALDMIKELQCRKMLGEFRGQAPADIEALAEALAGLGRVGLELDQVAEIDVNPIIIRPDGGVTAVDALVVIKGDR